ncbi:MAG: hypothetical protein ACPGUC_11515, partial [Gammaproteobacteria bacterium]
MRGPAAAAIGNRSAHLDATKRHRAPRRGHITGSPGGCTSRRLVAQSRAMSWPPPYQIRVSR